MFNFVILIFFKLFNSFWTMKFVPIATKNRCVSTVERETPMFSYGIAHGNTCSKKKKKKKGKREKCISMCRIVTMQNANTKSRLLFITCIISYDITNKYTQLCVQFPFRCRFSIERQFFKKTIICLAINDRRCFFETLYVCCQRCSIFTFLPENCSFIQPQENKLFQVIVVTVSSGAPDKINTKPAGPVG